MSNPWEKPPENKKEEKVFREDKKESTQTENEDLLKDIKIEDRERPAGFFEVAKRIESLDSKKAEMIWTEIGEALKKIGVFDNLEQEGIEIFKPEKDWESPYKIIDLSQEIIKERLNSDYKNIGGFYENGEVFINNDNGARDNLKDSIAFVASGGGIGRKADVLIHETYHGFQDADPEKLKEYQIKKKELEDKIKAVDLESKITGKPAYGRVNLAYQLKLLEEEIKHPELDSEERIIDRSILNEIHAHMFADPLKYANKIKSYDKKGINEAYLDFPIVRIQQDMIGLKREKEDNEKIYRYDYMKGKEDQAYMAFFQVEKLRTLGLNNLEIGKLISTDEFDKDKKRYKNLSNKIQELREKRGISKEELDKMIENFRQETVLKALKARNVTKEILDKHLNN